MKKNKNIWVIPTDKPSRLFIDVDDNKLKICVPLGGEHMMNQHIYITNDEKIKEGDYFWKPDCNMIFKAEYTPHKGCQKVILTTDQDLIKDGLQDIDDEFLEWFVKNPSCESVEVKCYSKFNDGDFSDYKIFEERLKHINKIIIPKEEQKQALIDMMKSDEELGLYDDTEINRIELVCKDCSDSLEDCTCIKSTIDFPRQEIKLEEVFNDEKKENIKKFIDEINNPSQPNQALKDAAQRYEKYSERFDNKDNEIVKGIFNPENWGRRLVKEEPKQETLLGKTISKKDGDKDSFEDVTNYKIERSYSEEEVIAFGEFIFKNTLLTHAKGVKNLFEQFKNK